MGDVAGDDALPEDPATFERLHAHLTASSVAFSLTEHEAVRTSEEAAAVRGVTLASGAKAMLLKVKKKPADPDRPYYLTTMSAAKRLSWKLVRKAIGSKDVRLATEDEVWEVTRCRPGAVPPFGCALFASHVAATVMDPSLEAQGSTINFNCGLKTKSMSMAVADYVAVEKPRVESFCE